MLINIGYENFLRGDLIAVIMNPDSAHVKKLRQDAAEKGTLVNATLGHKTRSVILLTTGQLVLSALQTSTFKSRVNQCQKRQLPEEKSNQDTI
jgi:regulator of extracellular matrix RemA (YlzA/DUF370 family)